MFPTVFFSPRTCVFVLAVVLTAFAAASASGGGLTGHWTFDGDFTDSVGDHDATALDGAFIETPTVGAAFAGSQAVRFDGGDDVVTIGIDALPAGPFSLSFWEYAMDTDQSYLLASGDPSLELCLQRFSTEEVGGRITGGDFGLTGLAIEGWHHHVIVHDSIGGSQWYIDGQLATENPTSNPWSGGTDPLMLGNRFSNPNRGLNGYLDDFQIYDGALDGDDANWLFSNPGQTVERDLGPAKSVVYREVFPGDDLTGDPVVWLPAEGWNNHSGSTGTAAVEETLLSHGTTVAAPDPVNSFPSRTGDSQGYLMNRLGTTGEPAIFWTEEYPDDLRFGDIAQISYDARHAGTDFINYVAVRVDTGDAENWYISGEFDGPSEWTTLAVDFATATWEELHFEPDVSLAMGEVATPDPDGNVTAFGIFQPSQTTNANYRYDNYTVEVIEVASSLPGDLNGDGFVGGDDLDIVRSFWGQTVPTGDLLSGDPSEDGFVGGDDLDIVRANWGTGAPPAPSAVPEPATLALFATGFMGLLTFGRQKRGGV